MCKADSRCVAYTVGRPAVLAANEYFYGKVANCCLEHRHYPSEAYVDATKETILTTMANTTCQHDASCWTRYEKTNQNLGKESSAIDRSITKESPIWPIADTYLRNGEHSTTNYGSEQVLVVKYASKGWTRHSLLQFSDINLLTLSRGRKAKLRLFVVYLDREASRTTSVARMPASFMMDEEISTWENSNLVEATFGDDAVTLSITQDQLYQWVEFEISDLLIDADEMVLSIDNSRSKPTKGNLVAFASKETVYGPRIVFEDYAAPPTPSPSKQCLMVWDEVEISEEEVEEKVEFIREGCDYGDETFRDMLAEAHELCLEEVIAESMAVTIVEDPNAMYTYVNVIIS